MSLFTEIPWADSTANFWRGCDKVSPGCKFCYITTTFPFRTSGQKHGDPRVLSNSAIDDVRKWNKKPWICGECGRAMTEQESKEYVRCETGVHLVRHHRRRVFSLSLGDWLDNEVPIEWLAKMLEAIRNCSNLNFLLLTKRPENFRKRLEAAQDWHFDFGERNVSGWLQNWRLYPRYAPDNVWLGVSIEDQKRADERRDIFASLPAMIKFVSYEPALENVNWQGWGFIQWLIFGGESGQHARACNINWGRNAKEFCDANHISFFCKQLGKRACIEPPFELLRLKHPKGGDISEFPKDLQVRNFPD